MARGVRFLLAFRAHPILKRKRTLRTRFRLLRALYCYFSKSWNCFFSNDLPEKSGRTSSWEQSNSFGAENGRHSICTATRFMEKTQYLRPPHHRSPLRDHHDSMIQVCSSLSLKFRGLILVPCVSRNRTSWFLSARLYVGPLHRYRPCDPLGAEGTFLVCALVVQRTEVGYLFL